MLRNRKSSTVHIGAQPQNLSFSGCGFLGIYHIGVASCFKQHAPGFMKKLNKLYGCSAGSLIGAMLLSDVCFGELCKFTLELVRDVRSRYLGALSPGFNAKTAVLDGLLRVLPSDAHIKCTGKLYISLTRVSDMKNIIVSEYSTRNELIDALVCSSFVPFYSGVFPPKYRGVRYVDGGLTNNLPSGPDTITVSPWSGGSDICPRDDAAISLFDVNIANTSVQITVRNLHRLSTMFFPPEGEAMSEFCKQGFREALRYLKEHGLFETVNPTLRSMSFSGELELAGKLTRSEKMSMSSKWISMQAASTVVLDELQWEEEDEAASDQEYIVMEAKSRSQTSSISECFTQELDPEKVDKFDANHNCEDEKCLSIIDQDSSSGRSSGSLPLPIATVVDMSFSVDDIQSVLHLTFPQVMLQALEESQLMENSGWFSFTKVVLFCGKPILLTKLPLDKSYSLAVLILRNASCIPANLKWLLSYLSVAVRILEKQFQAKSDELIVKLRNIKNRLTEDLKIISCQLCIIIQIVLKKLLSCKSIDLSWVFKAVGSVTAFSNLNRYLTL